MSEVQWIRINTNMFDHEKIRLIESLPDSDAVLVIWLKLLTLAGRCNDGGLIYITRDIPYNEEMLSTILRRQVNTVRLALNEFIKLGMIEILDGHLFIKNWEKHQNIAGLDRIREQNRARVERHRNKTQSTDCNVTVTLRNATEKNRIDKNRIEKNIYYQNEYFDITEERQSEYKQIFPHLNIDREYMLMKAWLDDNPRRRKKTYERFITGWLKRADDNKKPKEVDYDIL